MAENLCIFALSESGVTLPILALSLATLAGFAGIAIDVGRAQMVQAKLQSAVDAAGLAAGSTANTQNVAAEFQKFLHANFGCPVLTSISTTNTPCYMGSSITNYTASMDSSNSVITLTAAASLPTTFMKVLNVNLTNTSAHSEISLSRTGLELVFVLDVTGSMNSTAGGGVKKLQAMKTAVNTLVNKLSAGSSTFKNLWVGVVPFSQAVNIGTSRTAWINPDYAYDGTTLPLDWGPNHDWVGCVDARMNGYDIKDDPPVSSNPQTLFGKYFWTSDNLNTNGIVNSRLNEWKFKNYTKCVYSKWYCQHAGCPTSCSTVTNCGTSYISCTVIEDSFSYASTLSTTNKGPNYCCSPEVTPLTDSSTAVTNAVDGLTAQGSTILNEGIVWGWRMLSPRWRGYWGGTMNSNSLPKDYNTPRWEKVLIFLTDGENSPGNNNGHTAYWFLGSKRIGSSSESTAISLLDAKTLNVCTAMKNEGIHVYTIGLGPTEDINTTLLRNCATNTDYYYASPTTGQLEEIFNKIADQLSSLRIKR